jgi:acyl-CoA thioesterase
MTIGSRIDVNGAGRTTQATIHRILGLTVDTAAGGGSLVIGPHLLNSGGTLWGGCGLAAAIAVGESVLHRSCLWTTVQYVSPIEADVCLHLRLEVGEHGRTLSQAAVRGTVNGRLALLATGTFGKTPDTGKETIDDMQFVAPPDAVARPLDCPPRTHTSSGRDLREEGGILARIEQRWVRPPRLTLDGRPGPGRCALWARLHQPTVTSTASVAIIADLAPAVIIDAVGRPFYTLSLDNTLRAGRITQADWMLVDAQVEAVIRDVAHISARIFDEDGRLLAVAGQSAKLLPPRA